MWKGTHWRQSEIRRDSSNLIEHFVLVMIQWHVRYPFLCLLWSKLSWWLCHRCLMFDNQHLCCCVYSGQKKKLLLLLSFFVCNILSTFTLTFEFFTGTGDDVIMLLLLPALRFILRWLLIWILLLWQLHKQHLNCEIIEIKFKILEIFVHPIWWFRSNHTVLVRFWWIENYRSMNCSNSIACPNYWALW